MPVKHDSRQGHKASGAEGDTKGNDGDTCIHSACENENMDFEIFKFLVENGANANILAGILGAFLVLALLLAVSKFIQNAVILLVVGLMFGYFVSAIIDILFLWANLADTREYVVWGLGSFEGIQNDEMGLFLILILSTILFSFFLIRPLNAIVLGSEYASSLGINLKQAKILIIIITGVLAGLVTVYCGPVSFIGIAVPQLVRMAIKSKNHLVVIPFALLFGSGLALLADITVRLSGNALPLNTVTALIGAPVIIYTIIKMNSRFA